MTLIQLDDVHIQACDMNQTHTHTRIHVCARNQSIQQSHTIPQRDLEDQSGCMYECVCAHAHTCMCPRAPQNQWIWREETQASVVTPHDLDPILEQSSWQSSLWIHPWSLAYLPCPKLNHWNFQNWDESACKFSHSGGVTCYRLQKPPWPEPRRQSGRGRQVRILFYY